MPINLWHVNAECLIHGAHAGHKEALAAKDEALAAAESRSSCQSTEQRHLASIFCPLWDGDVEV